MITPGQAKYIYQKHKSLWIFISILIAVNIICYVMLIRKEQNRVESLKKSYMDLRKKVRQTHETDGEVVQYINAKKALRTFRKKLPVQNAKKELELEINAFLAKNKLKSAPVRFEHMGIEKSLFIIKYRTDFAAVGFYEHLRQFLADIQNSPQLFCIDSLQFTNLSGEDGRVELNLGISIYCRVGMQFQPFDNEL